MTSRAFVDTNVLVYLFDDDEPVKQARARELLVAGEHHLVLSTQVLGELFVTVTRKLARPLAGDVAADVVAALAELTVVPTDLALVLAALETSRVAQLSYWDALIVEAAASAGCDRVLTEDLAGGSTIRGVLIDNPFA